MTTFIIDSRSNIALSTGVRVTLRFTARTDGTDNLDCRLTARTAFGDHYFRTDSRAYLPHSEDEDRIRLTLLRKLIEALDASAFTDTGKPDVELGSHTCPGMQVRDFRIEGRARLRAAVEQEMDKPRYMLGYEDKLGQWRINPARGENYSLTLWQTDEVTHDCRRKVHYRLNFNGKTLFEGFEMTFPDTKRYDDLAMRAYVALDMLCKQSVQLCHTPKQAEWLTSNQCWRFSDEIECKFDMYAEAF